MNRKYTLLLKSQLGPKSGSLKVRGSKEKLWGILEILGHKSLLKGTNFADGQSFELNGKIWTPLGISECSMTGIKGEKAFIGKLNINNKNYELLGKE